MALFKQSDSADSTQKVVTTKVKRLNFFVRNGCTYFKGTNFKIIKVMMIIELIN